jgi:peptidyl-prolyl cis-trans isomerase C
LAPAPVKTRHGWHVVRLDRRAPARVLPFNAVLERIRASLHARSAIAASARYVEKLAASAQIEGLSLGPGV